MARTPAAGHRPRRRGIPLVVLLLATASAAAEFPGRALPAAELAQLRGGFSLGGLQLELGANIRTFANDQLVLETVVNITDTGMRTETATIAQGVTPVTPASLANLDLQGVGQAAGITFHGGGGVTTAIHQVTRERILGVLLTQAHDQSLRHELDVNVTVRNFTQLQDAVRGALLSDRLGRLPSPTP